jgi:hypothetical protein
MSRIILACALASILSVPARADETVKWRHVQHYASNQSQDVGNGLRTGHAGLPTYGSPVGGLTCERTDMLRDGRVAS